MRGHLIALVVGLAGGLTCGMAGFRNASTGEQGFYQSASSSLEPLVWIAPQDGRGMSAECACASVTGTKGEAVTDARSSVAECPSSNGQVLTQCPANKPLVTSGTAASSWLGLLFQAATTNRIKYNRDMRPFIDGGTNVWVASTVTCTAGVGMRPDGGGGSHCVAGDEGGTVLQQLTYSAAAGATTVYFRADSAPTAVALTRDGTTWLDITASVATTWRRATSTNTVGCAGGNCVIATGLTSSIANPLVGIRLGPNDAIDLDWWQDEAGAYPTMPVETTDVAATRTWDTATVAAPLVGSGWQSSGSAKITFVDQAPSTATSVATGNLMPVSGSGGWFFYHYPTANVVALYDGTNEPQLAFTMQPGTEQSFGAAWGSVATPTKMQLLWLTGGVQRADSNFDGTMGAATSYYIGGDTAVHSARGVVKGIVLDNRPTTVLDSSSLDWVGDSIVLSYTTPTPPAALGALLHRVVFNAGVGDNRTDQCAARWTSTYRASRSNTLIWSCGVNDVFNSVTGAVAAANALAVVDDAVAIGKRVIVTQITPMKLSAGWTQAIQDQADIYNALMAAGVSARGQLYVDTSSLGGGNPGDGGVDPQVLRAAYSYDLIRMSTAGNAAFAALVQPVVPVAP